MTNENTGTTRREFVAAGATVAAAMTFGFNRMAQADSHESTAITQIVKFKINMDNEESAIKALQDMTKAVEETEPGVLVYIAHRSKADPTEVVFFEVYADEEAVKAHQGTPHMNAMRTGFTTNFKPPLNIQALDRVSGFAR